MALTDDDVRAAEARMAARRRRGPVAVAARYDAAADRIRIDLGGGVEIAAPPAAIRGLAGADPAELAQIEVSPAGLGLHFPKLDADVYLPGLVEELFGSRAWMAGRLGAAGGRVASPAKAEAARRNGTKGGRPRQVAGGE